MKDKLITLNSKTSEVFFDSGVLGIDNENLTGNLIFNFKEGEFIDGTARLEIQIGDSKSYTMLSKENESYTLPIKNFLTKTGKVYMELVITSGTDPENPIVWKSNIFYLIVNKAINAEIEEDENYTQWIDEAEARLNVLDASITQTNNLDIDVSKTDNTATITITKKDGTTQEVEILDGVDGQDGKDGKDATINGVNTLTLEAGDNITLEQEGNTLTINSTGGGGGTGDYTDLTNKPKINNVELSGNKTTSDLGIVIPDVSNFITKDANNLTYYTKSSDLSNVATSGNYNDLTNKPDLSTKQDKIDSTHKLDADLVDDTSSTNKFFSGNYNDLTNKPTIPTVPTNVSAFTNDAGYTTNIGTITSVKMNGNTVSSSGEADLGTVITQHQDISGKEDKTNKVTSISSNSTDTEYPSAKCVYDSVNPTITEDSSTTNYTIASLTGNQTYKLGELTSLTITATTTFDRESVIYFTSGSTASSVSLPDTITNIGDAPTMSTSSNVNTGTCEASKSYIISILNNIAVWKAY